MNAVARATLAGTLLLAVVPSARAQEERQPGEVFRDCPVCPEMVVVPAGSFRMGSFASEGGTWEDEHPAHRVTIGSPFAAGMHEVTFAEWDACVRSGGCGGYQPDDEGWGRGRLPVIHVSWEDAQAYVRWLSGRTGEQYRLLNEAEWEYVARAGAWKNRHYWQGYDAQRAQDCSPRMNNGAASGSACADSFDVAAPVGSFEPNPFGLHDMLGNVWEWTEDCWHDNYTGAPDDGSAWRSGDCAYRVLRGGSWHRWGPGPRPALRGWSLLNSRAKNVGFRVARALN